MQTKKEFAPIPNAYNITNTSVESALVEKCMRLLLCTKNLPAVTVAG